MTTTTIPASAQPSARRRRGMTEQAAEAAVDQACRSLRLPTVRDAASQTIQATTAHLADWAVSTEGSARDLFGPVTYTSTVDVPFSASGNAVLNYAGELFQERRLRSVTANTRSDGEEFLALAQRFGIRPTTVAYPMADAPRALADLARGRFSGAAVLHNLPVVEPATATRHCGL